MICRAVRTVNASSNSPSLLWRDPSSLLAPSTVKFADFRSGSTTVSARLIPGIGFLTSKLQPLYFHAGGKPAFRTALHVSGSIEMAIACETSESFQVAENDLLVVGAGVLGSLVAQMWLKGNEGSKVVGQTNTTARHENLRSLGITPTVKDTNNEKFPYVIFCAPPSGSSDYPSDVRAAAGRWNGEGSLLFTSSSAVYDVSDNGICDEGIAPTVPLGRGFRTDNLLNAEEEVLKVGGNVVRLAGLYTLNRGAHVYYLSKGSIEARPDHIVNVIHYEDAAALCIAILKGESRGKIFMGCDNVPVCRQEMMDAVNEGGKFKQKFKEFTSMEGPLGKRMNNSATRLATGWKPKYESFVKFVRS